MADGPRSAQSWYAISGTSTASVSIGGVTASSGSYGHGSAGGTARRDAGHNPAPPPASSGSYGHGSAGVTASRSLIQTLPSLSEGARLGSMTRSSKRAASARPS